MIMGTKMEYYIPLETRIKLSCLLRSSDQASNPWATVFRILLREASTQAFLVSKFGFCTYLHRLSIAALLDTKSTWIPTSLPTPSSLRRSAVWHRSAWGEKGRQNHCGCPRCPRWGCGTHEAQRHPPRRRLKISRWLGVIFNSNSHLRAFGTRSGPSRFHSKVVGFDQFSKNLLMFK